MLETRGMTGMFFNCWYNIYQNLPTILSMSFVSSLSRTLFIFPCSAFSVSFYLAPSIYLSLGPALSIPLLILWVRINNEKPYFEVSI